MGPENEWATGRKSGSPHSDTAEHLTGRQSGGFVEYLARIMAIAGGTLLIGVMGMTIVSVIGRYVLGSPIPGDYEITELACAVAVFAFLPWCHIRNGNIAVSFFTNRLSVRHRVFLDVVHNTVFAVVACLITWRMSVAAMQKFMDGETTMFLGIPLHWAYFPSLAGPGLLTLVCLQMARSRLKDL